MLMLYIGGLRMIHLVNLNILWALLDAISASIT